MQGIYLTPSRLGQFRSLSRAATIAILMLASQSEADGTVRMTRPVLAELMGVSRATVYRAVQQLRDAGEIIIHSPGRVQIATTYSVVI